MVLHEWIFHEINHPAIGVPPMTMETSKLGTVEHVFQFFQGET